MGIGFCPAVEDPCRLIECAPGTICVDGACIPFEEDPCEGKVCGESCSTCPPGLPCPAVEEYCNEEGICSPELPICKDQNTCEDIVCAPGFTCDEKTGDCVAIDKDPCIGKVCGDICSTCPPGSCALRLWNTATRMACVRRSCRSARETSRLVH